MVYEIGELYKQFLLQLISAIINATMLRVDKIY
jgi:hypothetical protein